MTDDKAEKVIRHLQGFRPLAISGDVEVTHGSSLAIKVDDVVNKMEFLNQILPEVES